MSRFDRSCSAVGLTCNALMLNVCKALILEQINHHSWPVIHVRSKCVIWPVMKEFWPDFVTCDRAVILHLEWSWGLSVVVGVGEAAVWSLLL